MRGNYNLDVYKPYTEAAQEYLLINDQISSNTYSTSFFYRLQLEKQLSLNFGISYKYIYHEVIDKIHYVPQYEASGGQVVNTYYVYYPMDLKSRSHSIGLLVDVDKIIFTKEKQNGALGLGTEIFLFEDYEAHFYNKQGEREDYDYQPFNQYEAVLGLASINLSTYYRHSFQLHENFSLAARISLGTNLYSDWDQFKKYAWLGVGLEMGFGKVKQLRKKDKNDSASF